MHDVLAVLGLLFVVYVLFRFMLGLVTLALFFAGVVIVIIAIGMGLAYLGTLPMPH